MREAERFQINPPPAHDAIDRAVRTCLHDRRRWYQSESRGSADDHYSETEQSLPAPAQIVVESQAGTGRTECMQQQGWATWEACFPKPSSASDVAASHSHADHRAGHCCRAAVARNASKRNVGRVSSQPSDVQRTSQMPIMRGQKFPERQWQPI